MDLSNSPRLEKVRDVFCFGCFTGLRYSDIRSIKRSEIISHQEEDGTISKVFESYAQKTSDPITVPLNDYALKILEKYGLDESSSQRNSSTETAGRKAIDHALPVISNQKMNDYIKEIAQKAGIDSEVVITRFIEKDRTNEIYKKYELLATHSARRTFVILSLERKMRIEVLQKILGHASIRTTMKYVFILDDGKRNEMKRAWGDFKL